MLNEFRQDLVSGDWILFATNRAKGHINKGQVFSQPVESCPFEDPQKSDNGEPLLAFYKGQKIKWAPGAEWTTQVVKNKNPALIPGVCEDQPHDAGLFKVFGPYGFHELVITRDHNKKFADFTKEETAEVITVYLDRFNAIAADSCGDYVAIFHNHGPEAGATIYHNHSQIMSLPVIPPYVRKNLAGAREFFEKNGRKVYEALSDWELKENKRIVYQNKKFVAYCPFVSRTPYETRIFPLKQTARFNDLPAEDVPFLAETLNVVLAKIKKVFNDPDYNFYIHTAPSKNSENYDYFSWHVEIVPRLSELGGLELGSNIFMNVTDPDEAAEKLRGAY